MSKIEGKEAVNIVHDLPILDAPRPSEIQLIVNAYLDHLFDTEIKDEAGEIYSHLVGITLDNSIKRVMGNPDNSQDWWHFLPSNLNVTISIKGVRPKLDSYRTYQTRRRLFSQIATSTVSAVNERIQQFPDQFANFDSSSILEDAPRGSAELVVTVEQAKLLQQQPELSEIYIHGIFPNQN